MDNPTSTFPPPTSQDGRIGLFETTTSPPKRSKSRTWLWLVLSALVIVGLGLLLLQLGQKPPSTNSAVNPQKTDLDNSIESSGLIGIADGQVIIHAPLQVEAGLVISPTAAPTDPQLGQLYVDQSSKQLFYFNGTEQIPLGGNSTGDTTFINNFGTVSTLQGGSGISINGDNPKTISVNSTVARLNSKGDNQIFRGDNQTFRNSTDSVSALQVQDAAGNQLFAVDTANEQIILGEANSILGAILFNDNGSSNNVFLSAGNNLSNSYSLNLPDLNAGNYDICTSAQNCSGGSESFVQGGNSFGAQAVLGTNDSNSLAIKTNNNIVATFNTDGSTLFQNSADSTTAFQVQNSTGGQLLNIDTTNANITLNGLNSGALQAWQTNSNSLPNGRNVSGIAIANGYVYMVGGTDSTNTPIDTVYYAKLNADGSIGSWATTTALPTVVAGGSSVVANGYLYAINGANTQVYYAKLNTDGTVGSWNTTTPQAAIRDAHSSLVANGYVYIIGGDSGAADVYYAKLNADGTLGSWNTTTSLPSGRYNHASVQANGYVYVLGGVDGFTGSQDTVYYAKLNADGTIGSWNTTTAMPVVNTTQGAAVVNGYIYTIGGITGISYYAKLNADGTIGSWTATSIMPVLVNGPRVASLNGYIYAIGGWSGGPTDSVYYVSAPRILVGGTLDLVGLGGSQLNDVGGTGGDITAANGNFVGTFHVQGAASFADSLSVDKDLRIGGTALFQPATDTTSIFQLANSSGTQLFVADSTNNLIYIGNVTVDSTGVLLVVDTKNTAGDPTGVNGGMYYNSNSGKFRCYENSGWRDCSGGTLGYAAVTANQTTITSETDLTSLTSTVTVPANHRIRITAQVALESSAAADQLTLRIKESSTVLQICRLVVGGVSLDETLVCTIELTPSAGSHTYKLSLQRTSGSGNGQLTASTTQPASILVEDIGQ